MMREEKIKDLAKIMNGKTIDGIRQISQNEFEICLDGDEKDIIIRFIACSGFDSFGGAYIDVEEPTYAQKGWY